MRTESAHVSEPSRGQLQLMAVLHWSKVNQRGGTGLGPAPGRRPATQEKPPPWPAQTVTTGYLSREAKGLQTKCIFCCPSTRLQVSTESFWGLCLWSKFGKKIISCKMLPLSLHAHVLFPVIAGASSRGVPRPRSPKAAQADQLAAKEEHRLQLQSLPDAESLGGHGLTLNLSVLWYSAILRVTCLS